MAEAPTTCLPSSQEVTTVVMKNWLPSESSTQEVGLRLTVQLRSWAQKQGLDSLSTQVAGMERTQAHAHPAKV